MFGIGPVELVVVFIVALLVFGPTKLPELARTIGRGLAEFRRASSDLRHSMDFDIHANPNQRIRDDSVPSQASSPHQPPEPGSVLDRSEQRAAAPAPATAAETGTEASDPTPADDSTPTPEGTVQADSDPGGEAEEPKVG